MIGRKSPQVPEAWANKIRTFLSEYHVRQADLARLLTEALGRPVATTTINRWIKRQMEPDDSGKGQISEALERVASSLAEREKDFRPRLRKEMKAYGKTPEQIDKEIGKL